MRVRYFFIYAIYNKNFDMIWWTFSNVYPSVRKEKEGHNQPAQLITLSLPKVRVQLRDNLTSIIKTFSFHSKSCFHFTWFQIPLRNRHSSPKGLEKEKSPVTHLHAWRHFTPFTRSYLFGVVQLQQIVADVGLEDRVPLFAGERTRQPLKRTHTIATKPGKAWRCCFFFVFFCKVTGRCKNKAPLVGKLWNGKPTQRSAWSSRERSLSGPFTRSFFSFS